MWKRLQILWVFLAFGAGCILVLLVHGRTQAPMQNLERNLRAIETETEIKHIEVVEGTKTALAEVERRYPEQLARFKLAEAAKATKLARTPAKLARLLVRRG